MITMRWAAVRYGERVVFNVAENLRRGLHLVKVGKNDQKLQKNGLCIDVSVLQHCNTRVNYKDIEPEKPVG